MAKFPVSRALPTGAVPSPSAPVGQSQPRTALRHTPSTVAPGLASLGRPPTRHAHSATDVPPRSAALGSISMDDVTKKAMEIGIGILTNTVSQTQASIEKMLAKNDDEDDEDAQE